MAHDPFEERMIKPQKQEWPVPILRRANHQRIPIDTVSPMVQYVNPRLKGSANQLWNGAEIASKEVPSAPGAPHPFIEWVAGFQEILHGLNGGSPS